MKITKAQLKKLIKEELETMEEAEHDDRYLTVGQARAKDDEQYTKDTGEAADVRNARSRVARDLVDLANSLKMRMGSIGQAPGLSSAEPGGRADSAVRALPELLQRLEKAVTDVKGMIVQYNTYLEK
jgi:hypothetical protein